MRPISTGNICVDEHARDRGAAPMLQWIRIADLVVDDGYQRPIRGEGVRNVKKIVAGFKWSRFASAVVAPVPGGRYAIIDGQHRTTAAAILGIESVPCQVVIADAREQVDAFASINGNVTRMNGMALHHASLAAGDEAAAAVADTCRTTGVEILRYPLGTEFQKPGQTMAISTLSSCMKKYGRDTLVTALQCVTETDNKDSAGILVAPLIKALCEVISERRDWLDAGESLLAAFDEIDLASELENARIGPRAKGTSVCQDLGLRIRRELYRLMPKKEAA